MVVPTCPSGVLQEPRDDAALVVCGDRRMPALADRHAQNALLQVGQLPRVEQPFEEVGRPQVDDVHARPVEDLFGDEGITARITRRPAICGSLRLVEHRPHTCLLRGLGEVHRCVDETGGNRPHEVGGIDALHRRPNRVDVEQVAFTISAPSSLRACARSSTLCTSARTLSPNAMDSATAGRPVSPAAPEMRTLFGPDESVITTPCEK